MKKHLIYILLILMAGVCLAVPAPGWGPLSSKIKVKHTKAEKQRIREDRKAKMAARKRDKIAREAQITEHEEVYAAKRKERQLKSARKPVKPMKTTR